MVTKNGQSSKSEAPRIRADQEKRQLGDDGRWNHGTGQISREFRGQPISPSRDDWQRADSIISAGDDPLGGTVQQLIAEIREEISEIEVRGDKLRQRLTNLEELLGRLKEHPVNYQ